MSDRPAPWEHRRTPLARAFDAALSRVDALGGDATEPDEYAASRDRQRLLVSGLDVDHLELELYVEALTAAYVAAIAEDDDASDERAVLLLRGLTVTAWLAGRLPGTAPASAGSTLADRGKYGVDPPLELADPGDVTTTGNTLAERHRRARVEMYERHKRERERELGADQGAGGALSFGMPLRAVLELEAARLEGMASEISRWMPGPLWELFDGAARELRDMLDEGGQ